MLSLLLQIVSHPVVSDLTAAATLPTPSSPPLTQHNAASQPPDDSDTNSTNHFHLHYVRYIPFVLLSGALLLLVLACLYDSIKSSCECFNADSWKHFWNQCCWCCCPAADPEDVEDPRIAKLDPSQPLRATLLSRSSFSGPHLPHTHQSTQHPHLSRQASYSHSSGLKKQENWNASGDWPPALDYDGTDSPVSPLSPYSPYHTHPYAKQSYQNSEPEMQSVSYTASTAPSSVASTPSQHSRSMSGSAGKNSAHVQRLLHPPNDLETPQQPIRSLPRSPQLP